MVDCVLTKEINGCLTTHILLSWYQLPFVSIEEYIYIYTHAALIPNFPCRHAQKFIIFQAHFYDYFPSPFLHVGWYYRYVCRLNTNFPHRRAKKLIIFQAHFYVLVGITDTYVDSMLIFPVGAPKKIIVQYSSIPASPDACDAVSVDASSDASCD